MWNKLTLVRAELEHLKIEIVREKIELIVYDTRSKS